MEIDWLEKKEWNSADVIQLLQRTPPHRFIHFLTSHANSFGQNTNGKSYLRGLPFEDSILPILRSEINPTLYFHFDSKDSTLYLYFNEDEEKSQSFVEKHRNHVFLQDALDISIALSFNFKKSDNPDFPFEYTRLGNLEHKAKNLHDSEAIEMLTEEVDKFISDQPFYKDADYVFPVPSKRGLPQSIVQHSSLLKDRDISSYFEWEKDSKVQGITAPKEKFEALEKTQLKLIKPLDLKDKVVIILDDLYQSGATVQYLALKLKEMGAAYVIGLYVVKSLSYGDSEQSH